MFALFICVIILMVILEAGSRTGSAIGATGFLIWLAYMFF